MRYQYKSVANTVTYQVKPHEKPQRGARGRGHARGMPGYGVRIYVQIHPRGF